VARSGRARGCAYFACRHTAAAAVQRHSGSLHRVGFMTPRACRRLVRAMIVGSGRSGPVPVSRDYTFCLGFKPALRLHLPRRLFAVPPRLAKPRTAPRLSMVPCVCSRRRLPHPSCLLACGCLLDLMDGGRAFNMPVHHQQARRFKRCLFRLLQSLH